MKLAQFESRKDMEAANAVFVERLARERSGASKGSPNSFLMVCESFSIAQDNRLRSLHAKGFTFEQIAQQIGVSRGAVAGRAKRMGLRRR